MGWFSGSSEEDDVDDDDDDDNENDIDDNEDIEKVEAEVVPTSGRSRAGGRRAAGEGSLKPPPLAVDEDISEVGAADEDNEDGDDEDGDDEDGPGGGSGE